MINESDMNEATFRTTVHNGAIYAKDGGLMGIRCIVDKQGRCGNGHVRGMRGKKSWTQRPTSRSARASWPTTAMVAGGQGDGAHAR